MATQSYLDQHGITKKVEEAINATVKAKPKEPTAYLSQYFQKVTPPAVVSFTAIQILDSRGNPTVECEVTTNKGTFRAAVPAGASTGIHEAAELRDGGDSYGGRGVQKAIKNITNVIGPELKGLDPTKQKDVDQKMIDLDGTDNKSKLGANAILAVSLAVARAGAAEKGVPLYRHIADLAGASKVALPVPSFNIINGGSHAGNNLAMQEFMILPVGVKTFSKALQAGSEVYHALKGIIKKKYGQDATNVGDEGGFAPGIASNEEGLNLVNQAIEAAGYSGKVKIGMDSAASEFVMKDGKYDLNFKNQPNDGSDIKTGDELIEMYKGFVKDFPVIFIEDPFDQDDFVNHQKLTAEGICQVIGDDLLVTNPKRVKTGIEDKWCNALLLKTNQIGTLTEAIQAVKDAKAAGWGVMTSHRSGETEDSFIADLAVGLSTGQIKTGAPCRSERLAKYNQLLRIEKELGDEAVYTGENWRFRKLE